MKQTFRKIVALLAAIGLAVAAAPAFAGHGGGHGGGGHHGGGGFHGGPHGGHHGGPHGWHHGHHGGWHGSYGFYMDLTPAFWSPWYYDPYPYYRPTVIVQQPVYYVNRNDNAASYWYYCNNPQGYYPYVAQCDSKWVKVHPFPADAQK